MIIWNSILGVFKTSNGMSLLSPKVRLTTVSWRATFVSLMGGVSDVCLMGGVRMCA